MFCDSFHKKLPTPSTYSSPQMEMNSEATVWSVIFSYLVVIVGNQVSCQTNQCLEVWAIVCLGRIYIWTTCFAFFFIFLQTKFVFSNCLNNIRVFRTVCWYIWNNILDCFYFNGSKITHVMLLASQRLKHIDLSYLSFSYIFLQTWTHKDRLTYEIYIWHTVPCPYVKMLIDIWIG